ncbi:SAM-dependent methyltransferase [Ramlibacter tataouinensis]|uniref:Methyltransferase-like protein n=1 Tax=Ramlibacter tataouinensis (strain ATCC BAA-407 / DSM 14655 / LMG 21543 / TTB310) TaxID=365046 RepID=F5XVJ2_RAMTT|nr:methyltransferase domain-containing protein [Ramlibacter tataouinensis]AEG91568.1 methyltransferase-like protein [Ramlibacter tataouinensis TTB310]
MLEACRVNSARHYDAVARAWGYLLGSSLHYGYFESGGESLEHATGSLTARMLERLRGIGPGTRVLDVGCGTGAPAQALARRLGCAVAGISPSTACIDIARATVPGDLAGLLHFELGDAQAMAFADQSFEAAWVMESSHLMLDKRRLFTELRRVLKPGGQVVLCDVVQTRELALAEVIARRDEFLLLARVFGRALMRPPALYASQARSAGFDQVEMLDLTAATAPTFVRWRANAATHRDTVVRLIGEPAWADFVAATHVLESLWSEQVLGYFLLTATSLFARRTPCKSTSR